MNFRCAMPMLSCLSWVLTGLQRALVSYQVGIVYIRSDDRSLVWSGRVPAGQTVHSLIAMVDKTEHARRRRAWTRGLATAALKDYEVMVKNRSLQLVDTLASNNLKETQNLTEWFAFFAYVDPFYIQLLVLDHIER